MFRPTAKTTGAKESDELIVGTIKRIEEEIASLDDHVVLTHHGKRIVIRHQVLMTMVDGKCRYKISINPIVLTPFYPRKAYTQHLLAERVAAGEKGLKKHGEADKIDNCTCLYCLAPPSTYHDPASLQNVDLFMELTKTLGVSCMHLKVR